MGSAAWLSEALVNISLILVIFYALVLSLCAIREGQPPPEDEAGLLAMVAWVWGSSLKRK